MDRSWIGCLGISLVLLAAGPALGDSFTVDSTVDSPSANPGSGKCVSKQGGCTLRAAIEEANASTLASTITIPAGTYKLEIAPAGADFAQAGDLYVKGEVTISGADREKTVIDGGGIDRVFQIEKDATVWISGLTVTNGLANGSDGGGLLNRGHLSINNVTFRSNRAKGDPGTPDTGRGGALHNEAEVMALNVFFDQNTADNKGGGIYNSERGNLQLNNSTLTGNRTETDSGGGICNEGTMTVVISTVARNQATGGGGGIDSIKGDAKVLISSITGNKSGTDGGGIRNSGQLHLTNATIAENEAGANGGALYNRASGVADLNNVTIARNKAGTQGKGSGGGISNGDEATIKVANSLIALNVAPSNAPPDCAGVFTSAGYDLIGSQAGCTIQGTTEGNLYGVTPTLGTLDGSPTATMSLAAGSPGVDAGNPGKPTGEGGTCAPADQRGVFRPQAGTKTGQARCDMGAFELSLSATTARQKSKRAATGEQPGAQAKPPRGKAQPGAKAAP